MDRFTEDSMEIMDLPVEVLELIFDYLPVPDLKNVSLVCLQWSNLAFSGRRMHRVRLNVDYRYDDTQDYLTLLRGSKRQYRHVLLEIDSTENTLVSNFIELLEHFKSSVDSLKLVLDFIEYAQIRSILLEVPNLKKLSLQAMVQSGSAQAANLMQSPIKPLPQLTDLVLQSDSSLHLQAFDICTIAPNLKRLDMDCDSSRALEVFSHFSEQLESVAVFFKTNILFLRFCEISFPELLEIDFYSDNEHFHDGVTVRTISNFFARLKRLQCATLRCCITQPIVNILVENCRDITCLSIRTDNLENRAFSGLVNLTKLKVLTLDGWLRCKVFEGCKPLPALQELCLQSATMDDTLEFFKPLPAMMPNLRKLDIIELDMDDSCLHFICKHMVSLHQILLEICPNITENAFEFLNRLPHLFELSLGYLDLPHGLFEVIPSNEINLLSLNRCDKLTDDDLMLIPHVFPSLQRLKIASCHLITFAGIEELRSQMPWCAVIKERILE